MKLKTLSTLIICLLRLQNLSKFKKKYFRQKITPILIFFCITILEREIKQDQTTEDPIQKVLTWWDAHKKIIRVDVTIVLSMDNQLSDITFVQSQITDNGELPQISELDLENDPALSESYEKAEIAILRYKKQLNVRYTELERLKEAAVDWNSLVEECQKDLEEIGLKIDDFLKRVNENGHYLSLDFEKVDEEISELHNMIVTVERTTFASVRGLSGSLKNEFPNEIFFAMDDCLQKIEQEMKDLKERMINSDKDVKNAKERLESIINSFDDSFEHADKVEATGRLGF